MSIKKLYLSLKSSFCLNYLSHDEITLRRAWREEHKRLEQGPLRWKDEGVGMKPHHISRREDMYKKAFIDIYREKLKIESIDSKKYKEINYELERKKINDYSENLRKRLHLNV